MLEPGLPEPAKSRRKAGPLREPTRAGDDGPNPVPADPLDLASVNQAFTSLSQPAPAAARALLNRVEPGRPRATPPTPPRAPWLDKSAVLVRVADVEPQPVHWHWPGRLARGKLTLIVGDPGLGKSFLTLDWAALTSRGSPWPDGSAPDPGDVIVLSAEDGLADTIRPRLDALGADVGRIHVLTAVRDGEQERGFNLASDLTQLEDAIHETYAVLVVIDPLSAYLGGTDTHKDAEVRAVLAAVAALAERTRVVVVGVMHLTKNEQRKALYRAIGSVGFVGAARIVLAVAKDPERDDRRLLLPIKSNLSAPAPALAYTWADNRLLWDANPVGGVEADALLTIAPADREERRDTRGFLLEALKAGPVASRQLQKDAEANGITRSTLFRAKRELGVVAGRSGFGVGGVWYWSLPEVDGAKSLMGPGASASKSLTAEDVRLNGPSREKTAEIARASSKGPTQTTVRPFDAPQGPERGTG